MMSFSDLWRYFRLLGDPASLSKEEVAFLERFLAEQYQLREKKRIQYLMRASGIKRVKLLNDFDWTFNPKSPAIRSWSFFTRLLKKPCTWSSLVPQELAKATSLLQSAMMRFSKAIRLSLFLSLI